jgi:hypothetical protein
VPPGRRANPKPSPGYLAAVGSALADPAAIDAARTSAQALAAILRAEIEALAGQGVAYVALGNPLYPPLLTVAGRERLAGDIDVDAVLKLLVEADRAAVTELKEVPENFRVGLDLTDSGPVPTTERGYQPTALDTLLDETPFHRLCTDFSSTRPRGCPLRRSSPAWCSASASWIPRPPSRRPLMTCSNGWTRYSGSAATSTWRSPRTPASPHRRTAR